jgi:octanoyl-[GcvH]:protein N-octanoyltransferase
VILVTLGTKFATNATSPGTNRGSMTETTERDLQLFREDCGPKGATFGTALSAAILQRVAAGELPATARLGTPGRIVTFGRRDTVDEGYGAAVRAARAAGYDAVERIAGGRAAAYNGSALNLSRACGDPSPAAGTRRRFEEMAELVRSALAGLGVDARVGEVPGEYCPGAFSVNAGGRLKLAGIGQRMIKGGAHVGCVIVCEGSAELREVLTPVYSALGLDWDPATTGAVADAVPGTTTAEVEEAVAAALAQRFELREAGPDKATLALAAELEPRHRAAME